MNISISNRAQLSNRYLRYIKWKIYQLKGKFDHMIYAEIFLLSEGSRPKYYQICLRLGIPGKDIIIKRRSENLHQLLNRFPEDAHRYLAKTKT